MALLRDVRTADRGVVERYNNAFLALGKVVGEVDVNEEEGFVRAVSVPLVDLRMSRLD